MTSIRTIEGCQLESGTDGFCLSFESFGLSASVLLESGVSLDQVIPYLPPHRSSVGATGVDRCYRMGGGGSGVSPYWLYFGERLISQNRDLSEVLASFESDLSIAIATDPRHECVFVHAGVVGLGSKAIVIPGMSRTGKSTLVSALIAAGAGYYSDEFAVIDAGGLVHPYRRQPSLRGADTWSIGKKVTLEHLGGTAEVSPVSLGGVFSCPFVSGAVWNVEERSSGQAVLALLRNSVAAQLYPERVIKTLCRAAEGVPLWEGERGEAEEAVLRIQALLEDG